MNINDDFISTKDFNMLLLNVLSNENTFDNRCLITNELLEEEFITLNCKHTFNYQAIYKEVIQQKTKINGLETTKLKLYEIKCPYCRNITPNLLPPKKYFTSIYGVNTPLKYCMGLKSCKYIFLSGKRKGEMCGKKHINDYCSMHQNIIEKRKKQKEKKYILKLSKAISKQEQKGKEPLKMSVKQLKKYCKDHGIKKYSTLKKAEIIALIQSNNPNWKQQEKQYIDNLTTN
jgi:hypothetical protein